MALGTFKVIPAASPSDLAIMALHITTVGGIDSGEVAQVSVFGLLVSEFGFGLFFGFSFSFSAHGIFRVYQPGGRSHSAAGKGLELPNCAIWQTGI